MSHRRLLLLASLLLLPVASPETRAQQGPSQSVPAEGESEPETPRLFPELVGNESLLHDATGTLPPDQKKMIEDLLAEHKEAGGEIIKVAVIESEGKDPEATLESLYLNWQKDPDLLKEREALIVVLTADKEGRVRYSYDLEHVLGGGVSEEITGAIEESFDKGVGAAALAGVLRLLKALRSPLAEQERIAPEIKEIVAPEKGSGGDIAAWILGALGALVFAGFGFLLAAQEVHLSSEGAHRIRPHEKLRVLLDSAVRRMRKETREGPGSAAVGEWGR